MTVPEKIEQLKSQLAQATGQPTEGGIILVLLNKYDSINNTDSKPYIDRLLQLAENLPAGEQTNSIRYKGWGLYYLARLDLLKGEFATSLNLTRQALSLFEQLNDAEGMACACNNMGIVHWNQSNYAEALKNYLQALEVSKQTDDKLLTSALYNNIGIVHQNQGNYPEALKNNLQALQILEELDYKAGIAACYGNIGFLYHAQLNFPEALKNYFRALQLMEEVNNQAGKASLYDNIGTVYNAQGNYAEALKNQLQSLKIREEIGDKRRITASYTNIGAIHERQNNYTDALKNYFQALETGQAINDRRGIALCYDGIGNVYEKQGNYTEALKSKLLALQLVEEISNKDLIKTCSLSLFNTYKATNDFENALKYHEKYHLAESEMLGEQAQKQLTNLNFQHNMEQKEKEAEINRLRNVELKGALDHLQVEKDRSESLLLNILPSEVAEELKQKGESEAKLFEDVTVLFTDFKGFTTVSEQLTPQELVNELHSCFKAFDGIIGKYSIEKIKTVGDAYLAVSGLPVPNVNHAGELVKAAIEIRDFMLHRRKEFGNRTFEMRVGLHSGKVVAGIVGVKKFAYDIWGDTVNTAARMEQNGEAGKVNISEATYELVKDKFKCEYRGEIEAKNKGKLKMYFVD